MTEHKPEGESKGLQANSVPQSGDIPGKDSGGVKRQASTGSPILQKQTAGYLAFTAVVIYLGWGLINTDGNLILILSTPITQSLNLSITQYSYIVSAGFFASFVLSLIMGPFGDRVGRRFVLQLTLIGTAFISMLQYFINSFLSWFLIRIGAGAFTGSEWGAGGTMLSETMNKRIRGVILSVMQSGWVFGYGLASAISLLALSIGKPSYGNEWWRVAFLFAFLPALLVLVIRTKLKESPRFEHLKALKEAKKKGDQKEVDRLLSVYSVDLGKAEAHPYRQLFSSDLVRVTVVLAFWNFLTTGIAITTNSFQPIYFEEIRQLSLTAVTEMFTVVSFAGIIGYVLNGVLNDWIGAKYSIAIFVILEVLGIYLLAFNLPANNYTLLWAYYILFFFAENGQFSALVRLNSEAFPTRSRATGAIWGGAFWSLGQAVWPLIFGQGIGYYISLTKSPLAGFNAAWLYLEVIPEIIGLIVFMVAMKNIPPKRELEEIHQ